MHRSATWFVVALLLFGCAAPRAGRSTVTRPREAERIQVTGRGEARVAPDVAVIALDVEALRPTMADARETAETAQSAIVAALRGAGISPENVQATQLAVRPQYEQTEAGPNLVGYVVSNTVHVRVQALENVQHAVDTAITAGGDLVRLNGMQFEVDDPNAAQREARARALEDARADAREIAAQLGLELGEPISVEEVSMIAPPDVPARADDAEHATPAPIALGQRQIAVELRVAWSIAGRARPQPSAALTVP